MNKLNSKIILGVLSLFILVLSINSVVALDNDDLDYSSLDNSYDSLGDDLSIGDDDIGEFDVDSEDLGDDSGDWDVDSEDLGDDSGDWDVDSEDLGDDSGDWDVDSEDLGDDSGDWDVDSEDLGDDSGDWDVDSEDLGDDSGDWDVDSEDLGDDSGDWDVDSEDLGDEDYFRNIGFKIDNIISKPIGNYISVYDTLSKGSSSKSINRYNQSESYNEDNSSDVTPSNDLDIDSSNSEIGGESASKDSKFTNQNSKFVKNDNSKNFDLENKVSMKNTGNPLFVLIMVILGILVTCISKKE